MTEKFPGMAFSSRASKGIAICSISRRVCYVALSCYLPVGGSLTFNTRLRAPLFVSNIF